MREAFFESFELAIFRSNDIKNWAGAPPTYTDEFLCDDINSQRILHVLKNMGSILMEAPPGGLLCGLHQDIWLGQILPFVGSGHYIVVAGVCKQLRNWYLSYVHLKTRENGFCTYYTEFFSSVSRAQYFCDIVGHVGSEMSHNVCRAIAINGNVAALQHLQKGPMPNPNWNETVCYLALTYGNLDVLKYLRENGCPWDKSACYQAAWNGNLDELKYLRENGCPWDDRYMCNVAELHADVLEYVHKRGCPFRDPLELCTRAAWRGNLDVLMYAHENGCPWNADTCRTAASGGYLEVLKFLHENGCPWDESTCTAAAGHGHLEVFKYAHENGCSWGVCTFNAAIPLEDGYSEVLKYLRKEGCPQGPLLQSTLPN